MDFIFHRLALNFSLTHSLLSSFFLSRMAEPDQSTSTASSSSAIHREFSSNAASSSSTSQVREEEDHRDRDQLQHRFPHPELEHQQFVLPYQGNPNLSAFDDASVIRDDTWSCVIVLLTFWFFGLSLSLFYFIRNLIFVPQMFVIWFYSTIFGMVSLTLLVRVII